MFVAEPHSVEELRQLFKRQTDARVARRLQIVWLGRVGRTQPEITETTGVCRRSVQGWVRRYNQAGLTGLRDRPRSGRHPTLSPEEQQLLCEKVDAGPADDEVCSFRGVDIQQFLEKQFGRPSTATCGSSEPSVRRLDRLKRSSRRY